jgi:predicted esterase
MSLLYGLTSKNIIGGVIGLSGYLFQSFDLPNVGKLPILLFHGSKDQLIPIAMAKKSYEKIIKNNEITYF